MTKIYPFFKGEPKWHWASSALSYACEMGQTLQSSQVSSCRAASATCNVNTICSRAPLSARISVTLWGKAYTLISKKRIVVLLSEGIALFPGEQHYSAGMLKMGDIRVIPPCPGYSAVFTGLEHLACTPFSWHRRPLQYAVLFLRTGFNSLLPWMDPCFVLKGRSPTRS